MSQIDDAEMSDDEIFFGKLSLKELKKHILWNKRQSKTCDPITVKETDHNKSLKIIETHSEPNLRVQNDSSQPEGLRSVQDVRNSDDSFIQLESIVSELCLSPRNKEASEELNNTLDVIEYILNNGPTHDNKVLDDKSPYKNSQHSKPNLEEQVHPQTMQCHTENKVDKNILNDVQSCFTPAKSDNQQPQVFSTPSFKIKSKPPIFKTPANIPSNKKPPATLSKKTPNRTNAYQHIASPVASYIRNCPQVPLLKDVHPKKPLPGPSSIPKFVGNPSQRKILGDKENINLPSIAYRTAKVTKVIDLPDEKKLPRTEWVKKITSTLPRPVIIKHNHREMNVAKNKLLPRQEDSFADLSYHQADLSVCTQKTAFNPSKHL